MAAGPGSPALLLLLIFTGLAVFSVLGFAAFVRPAPTTPPAPPTPAPLVAGQGISITNNVIAVNPAQEPFQQAGALGEISGFSISIPVTVTITGISNGTTNLVEVLGATALSPGAMDFTQDVPGQMKYVGNRTAFCHTAVTLSMSCVSTDQTFVMMLGVNGVPQTNSLILQHIASGGDIESAALHAYVILQTNDYLSLFVGNIISISDYSLYTANGFAMCMYM
jgi:hypothetical protein